MFTTTAPPPDVTKPSIVLRGDESVTIRLFHPQKYIDAGADCTDNRDGIIGLNETVYTIDGLVTDGVNNSEVGTYTITYHCVDDAGNAAEKAREVKVENPCEAGELPTCDGGECTVSGMCFSGGGDAADDAPVVPEYEPPPKDTTPPVLTLKGEGVYGLTNGGYKVLIAEVVQGTAYVDPGVDAYDLKEVDGEEVRVDVTPQVFGAAVDTSLPSADGEYHVIRYTAADDADPPNDAEEVQRWIKITPACPKKDGDGNVLCDDGTCSDPTGSCNVAVGGGDDEAAEATPDPPELKLLGDESVEVPADTAYRKCPESATLGSLCDRGATATSTLDGVLTSFVKCGVRNLQTEVFVSCGLSFKEDGFTGCASFLDEAGFHEIVYSVEDSKGQKVEYIRKVKKLISCPNGDDPCQDGVSCPQGGVCPYDVAQEEPEEVVVNNAPVVSAKVTEAVGKSVNVPRFSEYKLCSESTGGGLCDPGAEVTDEEDLSESLVVCAPFETCAADGCVDYKLSKLGLKYCLDTSAAVGTVFPITFAAFDSSGLNGSDVRTVAISEPCADNQNWCPEDDPAGKCEEVTCEVAAEMASLQGGQAEALSSIPELNVIIPPAAEMPFVFLYGKKPVAYDAPFMSGPVEACTGAYENLTWPMCSATASSAKEKDVSSSIRFQSSDEAKCNAQNLNAGNCEVGRYEFTVSATSSANEETVHSTKIIIDIVRGVQRSAKVELDNVNCSTVLADPGSEQAIDLRTQVAQAASVPIGAVRALDCEDFDEEDKAIFDVVAVIQQESVDTRRRQRRSLLPGTAVRRASAFIQLGAATASPAASGPEYIERRLSATLNSAKGLLIRAAETRGDVLSLLPNANGNVEAKPELVSHLEGVIKEVPVHLYPYIPILIYLVPCTITYDI